MSVSQLDLIGGAMSAGVAWPPPGRATATVPNDLARTISFAGSARIAGDPPGIVTIDGAPAAARVRVYDRTSGALVTETISAADGTYEIPGISASRQYYVVALDLAAEHNAAIADGITPVEP